MSRSELAQADDGVIRVAVISDVHVQADARDAGAGGHYAAAMPTDDPTSNPFAGLLALADLDTTVRADVLLSPGDLADRAHPVAIFDGWKRLHEIAGALGGATCIAASGNHDVDSRFAHNEYDALGVLKELRPYFPINDFAVANEYWARHFCIVDSDSYRVMVVNTAAYHGYSVEADAGNKSKKRYVAPEYEHGRVASRTLAAIRERLQTMESRSVNILLCHHHLDKLDEIADSDYSAVEGAGAVLEMLSSGKYGEWTVFNGHRHVAKVSIPGHSLESPFAFTAASFSKNLVDYPIDGLENQFYLFEFDLTAALKLGLKTAARFRTWTWRTGQGWTQAADVMSLPPREVVMPSRGGFGFRGDPDSLRPQILHAVDGSSGPFLTLGELAELVPELQFVPPYSLRRLLDRMREADEIAIAVDTSRDQVQVSGARK